ncbi:LytTR family transcriptional regulator [Sphingobacterium olei]|uniref:LytTR family transcriptional regulator n=1 Tax=Sphingobacterium olei TaxID=2571155 RepID=A0A4U0PJE1_9SPHI|nr:LytTR family DNA-binding domain-containing protein [Sphingobacterium olei]TJZ63014.1 LytTR family transcriptional regulator [Sphingobacterium olei]
MIKHYEKLTLLFQQQHKLRYFPVYAQVILSILVSHYLCGPNSFFSMEGKWDNKTYWIVFGFSFLIAMFIFTLAQWMNKRLDKGTPWLPHFCKRMSLQVWYGVVGIMICELILMYLIFGVGLSQGWSWMWNYMKAYLIPVTIFVIIMNLIYLSWYMWSFAFFASKQVVDVSREIDSLLEQLSDQMKMLSNDSPFLLSLKVMDGYKAIPLAVNDIAFFRSDKNARYCVQLSTSNQFKFMPTLDELIRFLDDEEFCKVSRSYILHRSVVDGAEMLPNRKMRIILKEGVAPGEEILVSRESADQVKKWLEWIGIAIR